MSTPDPSGGDMSDDLVQRLRDTGPAGGVGAGGSLCTEAADRIEALEARNRALESVAAYLSEALIESGCVEKEDEPWLNLVSRDWTYDDVPTRETLGA